MNIIKNKYEQTIKKLQQLTEENNSLKKTLNISSAQQLILQKIFLKTFQIIMMIMILIIMTLIIIMKIE